MPKSVQYVDKLIQYPLKEDRYLYFVKFDTAIIESN